MKRLFNIGNITGIECPTAGHGTLDQAIELLSVRYPQLRHTKVYERDGVIDLQALTLTYTVQLVPSKTNG
jgi:hypothetical protein